MRKSRFFVRILATDKWTNRRTASLRTDAAIIVCGGLIMAQMSASIRNTQRQVDKQTKIKRTEQVLFSLFLHNFAGEGNVLDGVTTS